MYLKGDYETKNELIEKYKRIQIDRLNLSVRSTNALKRAEIYTLYELLQLSESGLRSIRSLGTKSVDEIKDLIDNIKLLENSGGPPPPLTYLNKDSTPYYKLLSVEPDKYNHLNITDFSLSVRSHNCLKNADILTLGDLLRQSDFSLGSIQNLGEKSFGEIKIKLLSKDNFNANGFVAMRSGDVPYYQLFNINPIGYKHIDIEFYPLSVRALNSLQKANIYTLQDLLLLSETELTKLPGFGNAALKEIRDLFIQNDLIQGANQANKDESPNHSKEDLDDLYIKFSLIPVSRMEKRLYPFFNIFKSITDYIWLPLARLEKLMNPDMTVAQLPELFQASIEFDFDRELYSFLDWLQFDLNVIVNDWFTSNLQGRKLTLIIKNRAKGKTLQECANIVVNSRQRVQQIEERFIRRFQAFNKRNPIIMKLHAIRDGDEVITPLEIETEINCFNDELLYLLRRTNSDYYIYDKNLDVFIIGPELIKNQAQQFVDSLPDNIQREKMEKVVNNTIKADGLSKELVYKIIEDQFNLTAGVYHRFKLTLSSIYEDILRKYYPSGIKVYSNNVMGEFRNHIKREYGDIDLPEDNRAIGVRIANTCVLCNRGTYISNFYVDINEDLMKRVVRYIDQYEEEKVYFNDIFDYFRDELILTTSINNRCYLHGVLKKMYGEKYVFKKDYLLHIVRPETITQHIEQKEHPLSNLIKETLKKEVNAITVDDLIVRIQEPAYIKREYVLNFLRISSWCEEIEENTFIYRHENLIESIDRVSAFYHNRDKKSVYKDFRSIPSDVFEMAMDSDHELKDLLWESKYDEFVELCLSNGITKSGALLFIPYRNEQLVNMLYYRKISEIINLVQDWIETLSFDHEKEDGDTDAIMSFFWRQ